VIAAAETIWLDKVIAEKIASGALEIITNAYKSNFAFFSGKSSRGLISGLFYLLGFRYDSEKKQKELAEKLVTTDVTIRASYRKWLETFPELFADINEKITNNNNHSYFAPPDNYEGA
jgi:transcription initiation factor TFIIIB Brf1 subunit/transcription initiation factor TFIIB